MRSAILPILVILQLLLPAIVSAQDVTAHTDTTTVALGQSLTLTVTAEGGSGEVNDAVITDFKVISRGTSTNYRYINGQSRHTVSYTYTLIPLKEGRLTIPPLPVTIDGKRVYTDEIRINVTDRRPAQTSSDREIFVEAEISKREAFVGEQLIYTFRLYRTVNIDRPNLQRPDFAGFTAEQVEKERSRQQVIAGKRYHVTEIGYVLIPIEPGLRTIEPAVLECDVVRRDRRRSLDFFFNDSFFGRAERRLFQTEALTADISPLPPYTGNIPFSGLVGRFSLQAEMEKTALETGDSTTLAVTINGNGNIMDAGAPKVSVPEDFKVYEDAAEEDIALDTEGYFGKKTFRMALVPVAPGEYWIDPVRIAYFDTRNQTYETLTSQQFSLTVTPSAEKETLAVYSAPEPAPASDRKAVEFTGRDILPLKEDLDALESRSPMSGALFAICLLSPMLLFAGAYGFRRLVLQKNDDPAVRMAQKSRKALQEAEKSGLSQDAFFGNLHRALTAAVCAKTRICREAITAHEAEALLKEAGYPDEGAEGIFRLLERIETARFSGADLDETARESLFSEVREAIRGLR